VPFVASPPRVLIAGTDEGVRLLTEVLGGDVEIITARSVREARDMLKRDAAFDYVVCNIRFDESRMFDFLDALRGAALKPAPRVVCVHVSPPPLSPRARPAIEAALEALGVDTLVDFPAIAAARGDAAAREVLRSTILVPRA
jgi:CheY-like chemotaxis protein